MTAYRRDIDGLRGIAILAVLLFHAFTNLIPGGYVGVDIFFVISGYLITGILLHGLNEGTFTFRQFYARRIRRIFPALAIVLLSTWIAGWFILFPEEYTELGKHMGASSLFISNIILWKEAGYFDRTAELKPLLHLWSLGVEEQFYIFWPALLLVFHRKRHGWAGLVALTAISFVANLAFLHNAPTGTFFLLPTRFWQLGLGGMLAYAELKPLPRRVQSPILCMLGLALILIACFTFTDASPYPGWRALLPTIGAALIILSASGGKLIGNKPLLWLGLISYPLYLWHWPLLAYARILHAGEPSVTARIIAVALAILLATLTYRFVKHPIRFGSFKHSDATIRNLLLTIFTIGIIGAVTWQAKGYPTARTFNTELMRDTEKLDSFRAEQKPCEYAFGKDLNWCITSGKSPTIALYGDSHADHLFPGVVNDKKNSWLLIGHSSCPPLDGIGVRYLDKADECVTRNDQILTTLVSSKIIKTVVLSARGMFYITNKNLMPNARGRNDPANYHLESTHETGTKPELYAKGLERTLTRLEQSGKRVILFMDNPELNFPAIRCIPRPIGLLAPNRATACYMPRKQALAHTAPYREVLTKIAKRHPRVRVYDPTNQLCDESRCYAGNEEMLLYRDANHLSQRGAQKVMADFVKWLNK